MSNLVHRFNVGIATVLRQCGLDERRLAVPRLKPTMRDNGFADRS